MSFIKDVFKAAGVIVGDMIEEIAGGMSRDELFRLVRSAQEKLAFAQTESQHLRHDLDRSEADNRALRDRVRKLELQTPALNADQATALKIACEHPQPYSQSEDTDTWVRYELRRLIEGGQVYRTLEAPAPLYVDPEIYASYPAPSPLCIGCKRPFVECNCIPF